MQRQRKRNWVLTRLGNATGRVSIDGIEYDLHVKSMRQWPLSQQIRKKSSLSFCSTSGKLGDSEDSFLLCCFRIDPERENFRLSATFTVTDTSRMPGWQAGYGLFVTDTLASKHHYSRFRNLLSVGRHRGRFSKQFVFGLRAVAGYRDAAAEEYDAKRRVDPSRIFQNLPSSPELRTGEQVTLSLKKTNRGFIGTIRMGDHRESLRFPGCDYLTKQEKESLYVGFGVAGNLSVSVSDICFCRYPGHISHTPEKAIQSLQPDYPFPRTAVISPMPAVALLRRTLIVSADGKRSGLGTRERPLDLQTALRMGKHIMLLDGVYSLSAPLYIPGRPVGDGGFIRAEHSGKAILDGSGIHSDTPIMILRGKGWTIEGLVFRAGPSIGLHICGDNNRIEDCTFRENGDTGMLLCAWPGEPEKFWPKDNQVIRCESSHNCDKARNNADGFGAKLSIGEGNRFSYCLAHHNIDDGFDLYTKRTIGSIGAVVLDHCVACHNGCRSEAGTAGNGSGFKLGGEGISATHVVVDCVAYGNAAAGFFSNSNPSLRLHHLAAWNNGTQKSNNYKLNVWRPDVEPDWVREDLLSGNEEAGKESAIPERGPGGKMNLDDLMTGIEFEKVW